MAISSSSKDWSFLIKLNNHIVWYRLDYDAGEPVPYFKINKINEGVPDKNSTGGYYSLQSALHGKGLNLCSTIL